MPAHPKCTAVIAEEIVADRYIFSVLPVLAYNFLGMHIKPIIPGTAKGYRFAGSLFYHAPDHHDSGSIRV